MTLTPQWLDELRSRVTLSSVIMRTTKLQRAGREWKACCPFHNEQTPSFTVNDDKGFYHCFGCQAHGDVLRWMTDQRGLGFLDAVKELAEQAGMEMPRRDPRAASRAKRAAGLRDVMQAAQDFFVERLHSAEGAKARDYLSSRGFAAEIVARFGFGYAPNSGNALRTALSRFDEAMLIETGMLIAVDSREPYDRFRDRLMLPIHDARGRIIAFGGRILDQREGVAKYLNSPDTPLFDKGRTLYNLHRATLPARQSGQVIVVEGYLDVVALADAGIDAVVAPLGTAVAEMQLEMLWRQAECPVLCFDGDRAGQRATLRAIERALPLLRPARSLTIVQLPGDTDPDDYVGQHGRTAFQQLLREAEPLVETLWRMERDAAPLSTPEEKAGLKARLIAHADRIEHSDIRALYRRELLARFSSFAFPKKEWDRTRGRFAAVPVAQMSQQTRQRLDRIASGQDRDKLYVAILFGLLHHPGELARHEERLLAYCAKDTQRRSWLETIVTATETLERRDILPISSDSGLPPPPDKHRYTFLREGSDPDRAREDLAEAVALLVERPALELAISAATDRFDVDPEGAFAEQQRLLDKKREFERRFGRIVNGAAG